MVRNEWGSPATKTFRKMHIRKVKVGESSVFLHIEIVDIVAEILSSAAARGTHLPEKLGGWVPPVAGTSKEALLPHNYGVVLDYFEGMEFEAWGFQRLDDASIIFCEDIESARSLSATAESARMLRLAEGEPVRPPDSLWYSGRPGVRELSVGDRGDDVVFLQELFSASDRDGIFSPGFSGYVSRLQERNGIEQTGTVTDHTWRLILPKETRFAVSRGDAGHNVRVLQAMIVAYDWNNCLRVTGRFDYSTAVTIRRLQYAVGLRITGKVRAPEWSYLLGRNVDAT